MAARGRLCSCFPPLERSSLLNMGVGDQCSALAIRATQILRLHFAGSGVHNLKELTVVGRTPQLRRFGLALRQLLHPWAFQGQGNWWPKISTAATGVLHVRWLLRESQWVECHSSTP